MSTKKKSNKADNAIVRFGKGFTGFFKRIGDAFTDVRHELKRVIWPTRQKLIQTCAVVLVVIGIAAVLLTAIGEGARFVLQETGFYDQKIEAAETTVLPDVSQPADDLLEVVEAVEDTAE